MATAASLVIQKQSKPFGIMQNIMELFTVQKVQKKESIKPIVSWRTRYSMNIAEIDHQHKDIIGSINKFFDGIFKGDSNREASYCLDEIIQTSWDHFSYEENLMELYEYPGLNSHKSTHDYFIKSLQDIRYSIENNPGPVSLSSGDYIRKWIVNHILATDKSYSTFMRLKGIS